MGKKKSPSFIGNSKQAGNLTKRDIQHHGHLNSSTEPDRPVGIYTSNRFSANARVTIPAATASVEDDAAALFPG